MRHKLPTLALLVALATLGGGAAAQGDGAGFDFQAGVTGPPTVGAGESFVVDVTVGLDADTLTTNPTTALSLTWGVHVPAGLKVIGGAWHGHPLGTACTSDCRFDIPEGTISQPYDYELVAARPGTYTLIAQLATTSTSDPDPSNNSASMQIDVVPLKLHLSSVAAAKPRAGKRFTWTVATSSAISRQGVRPDRATCSARVGAKAIAGKATITSGRVVCAWLLPAGSRGSRLVTTAHTTLAGATASLTRTFTIGR